MTAYLFRDLDPPYDTNRKPRDPSTAASPFQRMLSDSVAPNALSSIPEARRSFSRTVHLDSNTWAQRLDFNTQDEMMTEWLKTIVVPAGERLDLYRRIPFGHILTHLSHMVCCTSDDGGIDANIDIVDVGDLEAVLFAGPQGVSLADSDMVFTPVEPATGGLGFAQDTMGYVRLSLSAPYVNADGDGVFVDACNDAPCVDIQIRAQLIDVCFTHEHRGCFSGSCGCNSWEFSTCPEEAPVPIAPAPTPEPTPEP